MRDLIGPQPPDSADVAEPADGVGELEYASVWPQKCYFLHIWPKVVCDVGKGPHFCKHWDGGIEWRYPQNGGILKH